MKPQRGPLFQIFAAVLVCAPLVWSQGFHTNVVGSATACGVKNIYDQSGPLDSSGQAMSSCPPPTGGSALAKSQADLNLGSNGFVQVDDGGSGNAAALTTDTVTLIPPLGFNGNSVKFTVVDSYATSITNLGGTGSVKMCWTIPRLFGHCVTSTKGIGGGSLKAQVTLNKSKTGFQFGITKTMGATGTGSVSAGFATTGDPNFTLPNGWTCTFASRVGCT